MVHLSCIFLACIINFLFFAIGCAQSPSQRTASISGRVTVNGNPAVNALVKVVEVDLKIKEVRIIQSNGREFVDRHGYKITTNADGNYIIHGLPAGKYMVSALSRAYVLETRAQGGDHSRQITLDEGEAREKVDFALVRGGAITGRVTDDENTPQIEMSVRLAEMSDTGEINNHLNYIGGTTDDRGVYRIYGIRTGLYILSAGVLHYRLQGKPFEPTYHPNTTNVAQAQVIEVKEGSEVTGVDIRLVNIGKSYEVLGRVFEAETGKAVPQIRVYCIAVANQEDNYGNGVSDSLTDGQGNFRLTGVIPGKYKVMFNSRGEIDTPFYAEGKYFEIDSENVTGLELRANRGGTISGMVLLEEGRERVIESTLYQATVGVSITKEFQQGYQTVASKSNTISPDGSFIFIGIPPGNAQFGISNGNRSLHLLRVEHDGTTQMNGINVKAGENISGVKLIVGQGTGVIRGEVKVVGGSLPECCILYAWASHASIQFSRSANVDEKGRFLIEGLLNGNYTLQIFFTNKSGFDSSHMLKIPKPISQSVSVSAGAETRATFTYDLSRVEQ